MIGLLIPGFPIIIRGPIMTTNVVVDINNPKNINNISMFLTEPIFNDYGAALYYSTPPFQTAQFLGYVCNNIPSNTFYTGWSSDPSVNKYQSIKLGIKLETIKNIEVAFEEKIKIQINKEFGKKIAKNLYNYFDSFSNNEDHNNKLLYVPVNSFLNWYNKFLNKYSIDPNFLMKNDYS